MESRPPPVITGESKLDDDSGRQSGRRWSRQGSSEQRPYFERLNVSHVQDGVFLLLNKRSA